MLFLFLACAMLPLALQTTLVLRQVSDETHRQAQSSLQRTAKAMGMSLIGQLNALVGTSERIALRASVARREAERINLAAVDTSTVLAFVALGEAGDTLSEWRAERFSRLSRPLGLNQARKLLFPPQRAGSPAAAITATHQVLGRPVHTQMLIDPHHLFGGVEVQGWRDSDVDMCMLLNGRVLWCSLPPATWQGMRVAGETIALEGEAFLAATWNGFATVTAPGERLATLAFTKTPAALGDSVAFRQSLLLLTVIALVLVFLASHVQLRRGLRPLEALTHATQRVGARDFSVRVAITSDDEFGALAQSFNDMSGRIASHVTVLSAARAVNDDALRANSVQELLPRLTGHIRGLLPPGYGMSLAVRAELALWLRRSVMPRADNWVDDQLELGAASLAVLERGDLVSGRFGQRDSRPWMRSPTAHNGWQGNVVVLPLIAERELTGFLTIMLPHDVPVASPDLEGIRAIVGEIAVALNRVRLVGRLEQFNYGTLTALARAVDAKSPWTAGHSESVTYGALRLGEALHLTSDELDLLHRGGLLHDIGKIAVPGSILDKAGGLTSEEMAAVRSHPEAGARILAPIDAYTPIIPIVLYHHERFDGAGYPRGLAGSNIPSLARLVTIVDVYDALVSDRPYRGGWPPAQAVAHILEGAGTHFDPTMTQAFAGVEPSLRDWYFEQREHHRDRRALPASPTLTAA